MTTEPSGASSKKTNPKAGRTKGSDNLIPWYALTAVYLGFGALVLYDRWSEVGSLLEPPGATPSRLPLNSIGDVLAGFFAPLAFLWLFVATQLQRKELRLQREELAETRKVFDEQREELKKSALESNLQTNIMQDTLLSTKQKSIYETFSLDLYLNCRIIFGNRNIHVDTRRWSIGLTQVTRNVSLSQSDAATVDFYIEQYSSNLRAIRSAISNDEDTKLELNAINDEAHRIIEMGIILLEQITDNELYQSNRLSSLRIKGLPFEGIINDSKFVLKALWKYEVAR
ncbi:hypothetical protein [Methylobacterium sp. Leaf87]|uniref:hypothetical protein n=1 Tax=Methylobacterium sp. Leaf87 TaxID=1736243 RepID=UPI0012E8649C|nr:hypothetical protein [Methylobacterium sp. Leaf87]